MFTYYLSSLHELREKNLALSHATTHAWLEIMAHLIDGQYLIGRAILHPATTPLASHHPDLHWEKVRHDDHQELVMKWLDEGVSKAAKAQEIVFAAFTHHATGWGEIGHELMQKLQRDAGPEYVEALRFIDKTMQDVVTAESAALHTARQVVKTPRVASKAPTKPATKAAAKRVATSRPKPAAKRAAKIAS